MSIFSRLAEARLLVFLVLLSGCASAHRYDQPSGSDIAHLVGKSVREGAFDWEALSVSAVDDRYIRDSFFGNASHRATLTPGPHRVVVRASFNRQLSGAGPFEAYVVVQFDPRPGIQYRLAGEVRDNLYIVWIEDLLSGERVSEVASSSYQSQARISPVVPIFVSVPARQVSAVKLQ